MRRKAGFVLIVLSLILILIELKKAITGGIIGSLSDISWIFYFGLILMIFGILVMETRKTLDVIIIPTGYTEEDRKRTERALEEKEHLKEGGYFLISGYKEDKGSIQRKNKYGISEALNSMKHSQVYQIYQNLRKEGVLPKNITLEGRSHNTEENLLYSIKKIMELNKKKGERKPLEVGIVSNAGQLNRFEGFEKAAFNKGLADPSEIRFHRIETGTESEKDRKYENSLPRKLMHLYKLQTIERYKLRKNGIKYTNIDPLDSLVRKIYSIFRKE